MAPHRRELFLDNGRVFVEVPRLMTDDELARVFEAFTYRGAQPDGQTARPTFP
jgi:hypothetical protein